MSDREDPSTESGENEAPKGKRSILVWVIVPILLGVLEVGLYVADKLSGDEQESQDVRGHSRTVRTSATDWAVAQSMTYVIGGLGLAIVPEGERLEKLYCSNGTQTLEYSYTGEGLVAKCSIHEAPTDVDAERLYRQHAVTEDPDFQPEGMTDWGDASGLWASVGESDKTFVFVGRRGTRLVSMEWGGSASEERPAAELAAALGEVVELMARHEL